MRLLAAFYTVLLVTVELAVFLFAWIVLNSNFYHD